MSVSKCSGDLRGLRPWRMLTANGAWCVREHERKVCHQPRALRTASGARVNAFAFILSRGGLKEYKRDPGIVLNDTPCPVFLRGRSRQSPSARPEIILAVAAW